MRYVTLHWSTMSMSTISTMSHPPCPRPHFGQVMFYFQIVLTLSFFCIRFITFQYCGRLVLTLSFFCIRFSTFQYFITFQYCGRLVLTLSFFCVRFSIFMYSIRLVLVLSVFCASFKIYISAIVGKNLLFILMSYI